MSTNEDDVYGSMYDSSQDDPQDAAPADDQMDTEEFDQSNAPESAPYDPGALAASRSRLAQLDRAYAGTEKESAGLYQRQQEILDKAMQRIMGQQAGPSKAEIYFRLAAAMGKPTPSGSFMSSLGNVASTGADLVEQKRAAKDEQSALLDKYGLEGTNVNLRRLDAKSRQLATLSEAERRRAYMLSKPSSSGATGLPPGFSIDEATGKYKSPDGKLYTFEQLQMAKRAGIGSGVGTSTGPAVEAGTDNPHEYAQMVANYDAAPPTSRSLKAMGFATLDEFYTEVRKYNPEYSAQNFVTSQRGLNAFSTGKQGDTVRSFNVTTDHLDTYRDAAEALKNGNVPAFNEIALRIAEMTGEPAPAGFDATKNIVSSEVTKAVIGGQMAQADREEFAKAIKRSQSPAQMMEVFARYGSLMGGQLRGLKKQYEGSTLRHDFEERWLEGPAKKWLYIQPNGSFKPPPPRDTSKRISPMGQQGAAAVPGAREGGVKVSTLDVATLQALKAQAEKAGDKYHAALIQIKIDRLNKAQGAK